MSNTPKPSNSGFDFKVTISNYEFSRVQTVAAVLTTGIVTMAAIHYTPILLKPILTFAVDWVRESPSIFQQIFKATYDLTATSVKVIALAVGLPVLLKLLAWTASLLKFLGELITTLTKNISDWMFNQKQEVLWELGIKAMVFYILVLPIAVAARMYELI